MFQPNTITNLPTQPQQLDGAVKPSVPPRKRAYTPPPPKSPGAASSSSSPSDGKKRRVAVPSGIGQTMSLKNNWWKFGSLQKDLMKGAAKNSSSNRSISQVVSDEQQRADVPAPVARNLNTNVATATNIHSFRDFLEVNSRQPMMSSALMQGRPSLGFPPLAATNHHPLGANSLPVHPKLGINPMMSGFPGSIPNNSVLPNTLPNPSLFRPTESNVAVGNRLSSDEGFSTEDDDIDDDASADSSSSALKFRAYQAENWTEKFEELIEFRNQFGHCLVPNAFPDNPALAQWVKRQRYQYKLKNEGKRSTMSDERTGALEEIGFVWDSHSAVWEERLEELLAYKRVKGDCNVPSRFAENRQLAVWVKRQRRQYKFFCEGKASSMTRERIIKLDAIGFEWDLRSKNVS